jgi:FKBP-type peptidyl-prolyl cis-trans isomerase
MNRTPYWIAVFVLGLLTGCEKNVCQPCEPDGGTGTVWGPRADDEPAAAPSPTPGPVVKEMQRTEIREGTGPAAKKGDTVLVHYVGYIPGGVKFDSTRDRNEPFQFTIGTGEVIKGWDEAVPGMKKGGLRRVTIPPDMAYGPEGSPPKIPPNAALTFEIELLDIVKK